MENITSKLKGSIDQFLKKCATTLTKSNYTRRENDISLVLPREPEQIPGKLESTADVS